MPAASLIALRQCLLDCIPFVPVLPGVLLPNDTPEVPGEPFHEASQASRRDDEHVGVPRYVGFSWWATAQVHEGQKEILMTFAVGQMLAYAPAPMYAAGFPFRVCHGLHLDAD